MFHLISDSIRKLQRQFEPKLMWITSGHSTIYAKVYVDARFPLGVAAATDCCC